MGRTGRGGRVSGSRTEVAYASQTERSRTRQQRGRGSNALNDQPWQTPPELAFRITPGKLFRMITEPTKLDLPSPLQCLKYARYRGSVPSGKGGGLKALQRTGQVQLDRKSTRLNSSHT